MSYSEPKGKIKVDNVPNGTFDKKKKLKDGRKKSINKEPLNAATE